jgi:hypothetical protein
MEDPKGGDTHLSDRLLADDFGAQQEVEAAMNGEIIVDPLQAGHGLRGESQTAQYRDTPFAVGFIAQLFVVFFFAVFWGLGSLKQEETISDDDGPGTDTLSLWGFFFLLFLVSSSSIGIAAVSLDFMTSHAEHLMQAALMVSCVVLGAVVVLLFANDSPGFGFGWLFVLICAGLYAYSVQRRIPFASANLRTALSAIQMNYGVCMLAYGVAAIANLWVVIWLLAFVGVAFRSSTCADGSCDMHMNPVAFFVLLLSYFWTSQVLQVSWMQEHDLLDPLKPFVFLTGFLISFCCCQNVIHVTVSGVIGTWWFAPQEATSAFSPAIIDSFSRATTYSLGSICFGSLLVAIVQTVEQIVHSARQQQQNSLILCILECLLHLLQRIGRYFNKWSMCYIGLYGYDFSTAGRKALELFQSRGWSTIIR